MNLNTDDFLLMICATFLLADLIMLIWKTILTFKLKRLLQKLFSNSEVIKSIKFREVKEDDDDDNNN